MRFVSNHFCLAEINYFGKAANLGHYFCCVGLSKTSHASGEGKPVRMRTSTVLQPLAGQLAFQTPQTHTHFFTFLQGLSEVL